MKKTLLVAIAIFFMMVTIKAWALEEDDFPVRVSVLPVFIVPNGEAEPTEQQKDRLVKHLKLAQQEYKAMLKGRDTFEIADTDLWVVKIPITREKLIATSNKKGEHSKYLRQELFKTFNVNRFNCPYIFLVMVMSPQKSWASACGSPFNGGYNSGGGTVLLCSDKLDAPNCLIQGTMLHELGHAFGLSHVSAYGYDQHQSKSIMSYNKSNRWSDFTPPKEKGILIPEELRLLSMNKRVFPNLYFDPKRDIPEGYEFKAVFRSAVGCGIEIFGQKGYRINVTTQSGEDAGTKASYIVHNLIKANRKTNKGNGLIKEHMWMSGKTQNGRIDIELEFPIPVRMNSICVLSQCGGGYFPVKAIWVEADMQGFKQVGEKQNVIKDEEYVTFKQVKAKRWRLYFKPDEGGQVVIRGLRFFSERGEIFCPLYPTYLITKGDRITPE